MTRSSRRSSTSCYACLLRQCAASHTAASCCASRISSRTGKRPPTRRANLSSTHWRNLDAALDSRVQRSRRIETPRPASIYSSRRANSGSSYSPPLSHSARLTIVTHSCFFSAQQVAAVSRTPSIPPLQRGEDETAARIHSSAPLSRGPRGILAGATLAKFAPVTLLEARRLEFRGRHAQKKLSRQFVFSPVCASRSPTAALGGGNAIHETYVLASRCSHYTVRMWSSFRVADTTINRSICNISCPRFNRPRPPC